MPNKKQHSVEIYSHTVPQFPLNCGCLLTLIVARNWKRKAGAMKTKILLAHIISLLCMVQAIGQVQSKKKIIVKKGFQIVLSDTAFISRHDTVLYQTPETGKIRVRENPYIRSSRFYDTLAKRASGNRASKNILSWVVKKKGRKVKLVNAIIKSEDVFKPYDGYRIESISFKAVDLLEGSVTDTLQKASTRFGIFVNRAHRDTRAKIISHNLLFKVGDFVDPYEFADNERILRQFVTLRDARIYVTENKKKPKTVDVVVVTQDVASMGVAGSYSSLQKYRLDAFDVNMLGYARQLRVSYFRNSNDTPMNGFEITLREPNFRSTFIQGELQYTDNYLRHRTRLALARDFFTPEIKYAGGIELYRTREKFYFEEYDTLELPYTENNIDLWAGRSFQLDKRTNLIFATRLNVRDFMAQPFVSIDSNSFFYNRTLMLASVGLIKRNYLKSLRIRGFGRTEDVPVGGSASIVMGQEVNQFTDRFYMEVNGNTGKYFLALGYFNISAAVGSFFKNRQAEDGLVTLTGTYFSDLVRLRKTQARQFIYFSYTKGFNRVLDQTIRLTGKWEDINQLPPLGNQRMTLGFETVYFMPWYAYGFQFALFHRVDFNLLSKRSVLFTKSALFPSIQLGARMLNENLVLPRFSFDVTYFGKNQNYNPEWQIKFATSFANLFGTSQTFKPTVAGFN